MPARSSDSARCIRAATLTYVGDTVAAFVAAAQPPALAGGTIQLGTGHDVAVGDLVDLVAEVLGRPLDIEHDPARVRAEKSEVDRLLSSPELGREFLG